MRGFRIDDGKEKSDGAEVDKEEGKTKEGPEKPAKPKPVKRVDSDPDADDSDSELLDRYNELAYPQGVQEGLVMRAACDARAFGGACVLPITTQSMRTKPHPELPFEVDRLTSVNKQELEIIQYRKKNGDKGATVPEIMRIVGPHPETGLEFHVDRGIWFPGAPVIGQRRADYYYFWDDSVLQNVYQSISRYGLTWEAISHLIHEASISVLKMDGLLEAMAADNQAEVEGRMNLMSMMKSITRTIFLKTDEEYDRHDLTLTGYPDMMALIMLDVCGSAGYPATVLFGREPAGMNSNGENDQAQWRALLRSIQMLVFKPRIERVLKNLNGGEKVKIKFPPLMELSEPQKMEYRERQANADRTYVDMQKTPEGMEVVLARVADGTLGIDLSEEDISEKEEMIELLREEAKAPPPPPGMPGSPGMPGAAGGPPGAPKPATPMGKPPTAGAGRGDPGARRGPRTGAAQ